MDLPVQIREKIGTSAVNAVRKQGFIPVEIYGHGVQNIHAAVLTRDFMHAYTVAGETTVITLALPNEKIPALIYAVAHDPRTGAIIHADLYRVRMDEKITARVPIEFTGDSQAVKAGGVLVKAVHEIEVEALPGDMPHLFTADLSRITVIGGSVCVKDVLVGGSVPRAGIIKVAPNMVIATIIAPRVEEETPSAAPTMEEVKVETEEKKALRQAQGVAERGKTKGAEEAPADSSF